MISIAQPVIGPEEIKAVNAVLKSGMLAQGPKVAELEEKFAKYCGTKYAVAFNSGTAAIHSALFAAGVGPGDEVITTPFSFIATINPILMLGAKPVLVDIEQESFNIDSSKIERAITKKTKAILPVHLYGQPANMDEINALARKYKLVVIEDACQAIGATYKTKKAGNLGDMGCFSLYATKNIMSGEGGITTTNDEKYVRAMKSFRQHGMNTQYEYDYLGYNYRMTDLHAAIAIEQLKKTDKFNNARQENARALNALLKDTQNIVLPVIKSNRSHVYHQYTVRITKKSPVSVQSMLKEKGVIAGVYYPKPLHLFKHIARVGYKKGDFPVAEKVAGEVLSLPIHPLVTERDIARIASALVESINA